MKRHTFNIDNFADRYMKYLYPYEREKEALSTQEQLQTAIETNRRESRRNNYAYSANNDNLVSRNQHNSMPQNAMPLPLSIAQMAVAANESQHHVVNGHPHASQHHPQHGLPPNLATSQSKYLPCLLRNPFVNFAGLKFDLCYTTASDVVFALLALTTIL